MPHIAKMASSNLQYPDYLNPFGSDEEDEAGPCQISRKKKPTNVSQAQYPDHLDPFSNDDQTGAEFQCDLSNTDDYDDSLNPFGEEDGLPADIPGNESKLVNAISEEDGGNPFEVESEINEVVKEEDVNLESTNQTVEPVATPQRSPTPDLTEPPKPLPRTKSLLKKEQANKRRSQGITDTQANSLPPSSSTNSASTTSEIKPQNLISTIDSFQKKKNKRLAPPVPINFKRQVSGSLDEIEQELEGIGDKLAIIDKESVLCQQTLTSSDIADESAINSTRSKYVELIKRRNSIVKRQKELMYKKRELKLDQDYSDIEYELRLIGNKQQSTRTAEDGLREKELLKKLVEIVEEKNDIVENLNRDTSCDTREVEEAFKRLNISLRARDDPDKEHGNNTTKQIVLSKGGTCDKKGLARLSKIATLLPRSESIKMKRKRLFKKNCDSRPREVVKET